MIILEAIEVSKIYGKKATSVKALNRVNLVVHKGEFLTIVGPSGSGKSTLLHILGGIDRPTEGTVKINGEDICCYSEKELARFRRQEVGLVFQQYNLIPVLTVKENIELAVKLDRKEVNDEYIEELIKLIGLENRINHLPNQLSGGQQQRVAIARALASKPSIILADEPTGNLDTNTTRELIYMLRMTIKKYNQTLIMITHDVEISKSSDRIVKIIDGHLYDND